MDLSAALDQVVDALVLRIADRLRTINAPAAPVHYDPEHLPPGVTRNWFVRKAPGMPGARKVGRSWVVEKSDFDVWLASQKRTRKSKAERKLEQDAQDAADLAKFGYKRR